MVPMFAVAMDLGQRKRREIGLEEGMRWVTLWSMADRNKIGKSFDASVESPALPP